VGPTPTLPPNQPPTRTRSHRTPQPDPNDLVLGVDADQPPARPAELAAEPQCDGDLPLDPAAQALHRELLEPDPASRNADRPPEPQPLGRRLAEPLDTSREGVER
jgi:hypothetical protein